MMELMVNKVTAITNNVVGGIYSNCLFARGDEEIGSVNTSCIYLASTTQFSSNDNEELVIDDCDFFGNSYGNATTRIGIYSTIKTKVKVINSTISYFRQGIFLEAYNAVSFAENPLLTLESVDSNYYLSNQQYDVLYESFAVANKTIQGYTFDQAKALSGKTTFNELYGTEYQCKEEYNASRSIAYRYCFYNNLGTLGQNITTN